MPCCPPLSACPIYSHCAVAATAAAIDGLIRSIWCVSPERREGGSPSRARKVAGWQYVAARCWHEKRQLEEETNGWAQGLTKSNTMGRFNVKLQILFVCIKMRYRQKWLVRGLVKFPGKARPGLADSRGIYCLVTVNFLGRSSSKLYP